MGNRAAVIVGVILLMIILGVGAYYGNKGIQAVQTGPQVVVTPTPTLLAPTPTSTGSNESNIIMTSPSENEQVGRTFTIRGVARVFENVLQIRVSKQGQKPYINQNIMANSPDTGQYGEYTYDVDLRNATDLKSGDTIIVEAFQYSAKDGTETDVVSRTVTLR